MIQLTKKEAGRIKRRNFTVAAITGILSIFFFYQLSTDLEGYSVLAKGFVFVLAFILGVQANISLRVGIDYRRSEKNL